MSAWMRSPRGSVAAVVAVALVLIGLWLTPILRQRQAAGSSPQAADTPRATPTPPAPGAAVAPPALPTVADKGGGAEAPRDGIVASLADVTTRGDAADQGSVPSFDIVRVDPRGDAVVAGRGAPGTVVRLMDRGTMLAEVTVDAGGQFALLPPTLAAGDHYLTLQVTRDGKPVVSSQGVAVSVAADASAPMVALLSPDQPARILSEGGTKPAGAPAVPPMPALASASRPVSIQSVETGGRGTFTASGVAKAGSQCRVYLNGAFLADVTAGADGRWSVKIQKGMKAGKYTVRADQLEGAGGTVVDRAEVPFDFPASSAVGHAKRMLMAKALAHGSPGDAASTTSGSEPSMRLASADPEAALAAAASPTDAAAAVVADLQSATVVHGDSLWRISRKMLGHGVNYTEIYASNVRQIRNPRLIYPGQIFVLPHHLAAGGKVVP